MRAIRRVLFAGSLRRIALIVVAHDHRLLDVFGTICEMEDSMIRKQERPAA